MTSQTSSDTWNALGISPEQANALESISEALTSGNALRGDDIEVALNLIAKDIDEPARQSWLASIKDKITNPDMLLFIAAATTLYGNASYVKQYADAAAQSDSSTMQSINAVHALIFASFTLEKIFDITKSGLPTLANHAPLSRREAMKKIADGLATNYPPFAGLWLSGNQLASGATFATQAGVTEQSKPAITAGTRALGFAAALGMTLYKYQSLLEQGKDIDPRIKVVMDPINNKLGGVVRSMGGVFPYLAVAMLTAPHVSIFYNKYTDKKNPVFSWPSVSTAVGYAAFVAYLASKGKPKTEKEIENEVTDSLNDLQKLMVNVRSFADALSSNTRGEISSGDTSTLLIKNFGLDKSIAQSVAKRIIPASQEKMTSGQIIQNLCGALAKYKIDMFKTQNPEWNQDEGVLRLLRFQLSVSLLTAVQQNQPQLPEKEFTIESSRRDLGRNALRMFFRR